MLYGHDAATFLKEPEERRKDKWRKAFEEVLKQFEGAREEHHFLGLHFIYRYEQIPSCIADFSQLVAWKPDCIVTFIDDAYCVRERIHRGGYTSFTLSELVLWRAEEILVGDLLARIINPTKPIPHFVIAVKHPAEMLARLLLRPNEIVRVYTSYPISDTRNKKPLRIIIDVFRQKMREQKHCMVFDPLTIDDYFISLRNSNLILTSIMMQGGIFATGGLSWILRALSPRMMISINIILCESRGKN